MHHQVIERYRKNCEKSPNARPCFLDAPWFSVNEDKWFCGSWLTDVALKYSETDLEWLAVLLRFGGQYDREKFIAKFEARWADDPDDEVFGALAPFLIPYTNVAQKICDNWKYDSRKFDFNEPESFILVNNLIDANEFNEYPRYCRNIRDLIRSDTEIFRIAYLLEACDRTVINFLRADEIEKLIGVLVDFAQAEQEKLQNGLYNDVDIQLLLKYPKLAVRLGIRKITDYILTNDWFERFMRIGLGLADKKRFWRNCTKSFLDALLYMSQIEKMPRLGALGWDLLSVNASTEEVVYPSSVLAGAICLARIEEMDEVDSQRLVYGIQS